MQNLQQWIRSTVVFVFQNGPEVTVKVQVSHLALKKVLVHITEQ